MKGINNVYSTLMLFRDVQYTWIDPTEEVRWWAYGSGACERQHIRTETV